MGINENGNCAKPALAIDLAQGHQSQLVEKRELQVVGSPSFEFIAVKFGSASTLIDAAVRPTNINLNASASVYPQERMRFD
jgi:hypothetical protein